MKMHISSRISLAIGLLLFLFFVTNGVSFYLTTQIEMKATNLVDVVEPQDKAATELDQRDR